VKVIWIRRTDPRWQKSASCDCSCYASYCGDSWTESFLTHQRRLKPFSSVP